MRKYKRRVVFVEHRIHTNFGMAAEFPEQGSGASFQSASNVCDAFRVRVSRFGVTGSIDRSTNVRVRREITEHRTCMNVGMAQACRPCETMRREY